MQRRRVSFGIGRGMTLEQLYDHALQFWGRAYVWGGSGDVRSGGGFDCSGLCQAILELAGMDPPGDQTADGLYRYFRQEGRGVQDNGGLGALAFFGRPTHITHVGFCLDKRLMINASGGGPKTINVAAAKKQNASVKIEPIHRRGDLVQIIMPNYASRGIY